MVFKNEMIKKETIFTLVGAKFQNGVEMADAWLEKWEGHYKIIRDESGDEDSVHDIDIICTEESHNNMSKDIQCISDWSEDKIEE